MNEQAEEPVENATDFYLQELVVIVLQEARKKRTIAYPLTLSMTFLIFWLIYLVALQPDPSMTSGKILFLSTLILIPFSIFAGLSKMPAKRVRDAVLDITHIDSPEAIQALFNIEMHITDRTARDLRYRTIINWLLGMDADKAQAVPAALRTRVRKMVVDPASSQIGQARSEKMLAWLHAVEFIGDAKVVPVVRKCAFLRGKSTFVERVRNKAQEVLPKLERRLAEEARMSSLLRPADEPLDNNLLRAAANTYTAEETLVRPATLEIGAS